MSTKRSRRPPAELRIPADQRPSAFRPEADGRVPSRSFEAPTEVDDVLLGPEHTGEAPPRLVESLPAPVDGPPRRNAVAKQALDDEVTAAAHEAPAPIRKGPKRSARARGEHEEQLDEPKGTPARRGAAGERSDRSAQGKQASKRSEAAKTHKKPKGQEPRPPKATAPKAPKVPEAPKVPKVQPPGRDERSSAKKVRAAQSKTAKRKAEDIRNENVQPRPASPAAPTPSEPNAFESCLGMVFILAFLGGGVWLAYRIVQWIFF